MKPPTVSTRGDFNMVTGKLNPGASTTSYKLAGSPFPGLQNNMSCPDTTIIFVHGWATNPQQAIDNYNDIAPALSSKGFVTIFSWDSNNFPPVDDSISIVEAGHTAQTIADQNALKLAKFIFDYGTACPQMKIRLITHSLGNRVVLQTLNVLNQYRILFPDRWNKLLTSVDLMAAGVPSSSVGENGEFHDGLAMAADIHNYYSSKDPILNILEFADNLPSYDPALGHTDAPAKSIYNIDVTDIVGEDHHAYISPTFMQQLTEHWDHRMLFERLGPVNFSPSSFCYSGIQDCTADSILLNITNGSSICNPAFDECSPEAITEANIKFLENRNRLTSEAESSIDPAVSEQLSRLFDEVFVGNSNAVPELLKLFASLKENVSSNSTC
jgi:hypothetical protein